LIATASGFSQLVGNDIRSFPIKGMDPRSDVFRLLRDRDGGLWVGTLGRGLAHTPQERSDVFTETDGLSGDAIQALYEDREGNIWVGTDGGLDRFRELPVTPVSKKQGLSIPRVVSVLAARDRSVWVGTSEGLNRWKDGRMTVYRTADGLPDEGLGTEFEDSTGRIVVSTLRGLAAFTNGKFVPFSSVSTRIVYNIVEEQPGSVWLDDQEGGLIHLVGDRVVQQIPWGALGHDDHATALLADRAGNGLWLGFYNGGIAFVDAGAIRRSYGAAEGLGADRVLQLQFDRDGSLWVATEGGLSHLKDNRIATLTSRNGLPCDAVNSIVDDGDRALWLTMPCGLVRIGSADLTAWIADPTRSVKTRVFDQFDGFRTSLHANGFNPIAARSQDGRLWMVMTDAVGVIDPSHLKTNSLTPPVRIEQVVADRRTYDIAMTPTDSVRLSPRVHDLEVDYTALSLGVPEKVQFRYKLDGVDRDWREVGNRRQAFYTDLPPRQYRFHVAAANRDGIWDDTGAAVDISIPPAYYQTNWFASLVVGMTFALIWAAHRVRVRVVEKHEREISALNERMMKAQEQERIRIAGELHDGVMQQMLAVTMMLGTAKRKIASNPVDAEASIEKIQQKVIQTGTDIRQLSHGLHPPLLQDEGLPGALRSYCEQFSTAAGISVTCEAEESARELSRGSALALFRITQEALGNAAKHGSAKHVRVRLERSNGTVTLAVSDDGVGFDRSQLGAGGGLGLVMMRERAGQLNGTFEFESAPGRGTVITIVIPFR
jgi:signal transduction histidine kinase